MLTRPTLDRTRESLFNILANGVLEGASVLDIFAGTGALGLEALSRGAAHCVFIDHYTQALIRQNAELCGFGGQYEILRMEAGYSMDAVLRVRNCLYAHYVGPMSQSGLASQKLNILAFEHELELTGTVYTIFVNQDEDEGVVDTFMETK